MTIKDSDIIKVDQPPLNFWERMYIPPVIVGLLRTLRHWMTGKKTMQYPEQRRESMTPAEGGLRPVNYRGVHRLNKDRQGRVECVACFMCETACPAHCIHIVGGPAPWPDREKYPESFWIDELRCIYCGMCEYACPVDAIELTPVYNLVGTSREQMIYDKDKLLEMYDKTKDMKPRRFPPIVGYECDFKREAVDYWKKIKAKETKL